MRGLRLGLALISIMLLAGTATAASYSYSLSVNTDAQTYTGAASIHVGGQVTPAPGPNTAVLIRIFNPNNVIVTADARPVNGTTGLYADTIVAGGSSNWINGNYKINATWGAFGPTIFSVATFSWFGTATTTITSTSTSTTTSTSSSTSSSKVATSWSTTPTTTTSSSTIIPPTTSPSTSSSTSSGGGGGIPEFPFQYVTVAVFTILVVASYLVLGRGRKLGTPSHY